jgi:hypothetical protein
MTKTSTSARLPERRSSFLLATDLNVDERSHDGGLVDLFAVGGERRSTSRGDRAE